MEWYGTCYHILIIYIFQAVAQQSPSLQCGAKTFNKLSFDPPVRSGLFSAGRLMYVPLEQLVNGDICQLVSSTSELPHSSYPFTNFQQIITICGNCTECPSSLNVIYLYLERMLKHMKISLIVIIRGINHRQINNFENDKRICFAFIEDEIPTTLNDCLIVDNAEGDALRNFSKTSVLFVSISFIILMAISLVWLVFYYVQRFRYAHAKDRLQRRLFNAAKKALARIPTRSVRVGDEELDADCPVCIDPYQTGDIVRSLPCRHTFHKTCVDPWLLEHRTCPMCKNDILKAFGYHVSANHRRMPNNTRQQSIHQMSRDGDRLSVDVLSSTSSELVIPYAGQSEVQDPFNLSSTTPPQLVQVMHCSSANTFSIIPLTVHNVPSPSCVNETQPITNQEQKTNGETRKISWHIRRPSTAGHIVSLVHVRSRSLSHAVSSEIPRPKVTFRSYTFGSGLATLRVPSSGKRVEPMINGLPSTFAPDMSNSISCCISSTDCYMPAKCSSKRVSLKEKRRPKLNGLASVESL